MSLKREEYLILSHILQEPLIPYSRLAEKIKISEKTKLSSPTVKKRIEGLLDENVITSFHAEYHPESMGLESHIFLLSVDSIDKYRIVERIIDYHPYLVVRQRCYGGITGIFLKVHIPIGSISKFISLLNHLKDNNLITEIVHSTTIGRGIKTRIDLSYWDPTNGKWSFNWDIWKKNIDSVDYVPQFDYFQRISRNSN